MSIFIKKPQDGRQLANLSPTMPIFNRVLKCHTMMIHIKFGDDISKRLDSRAFTNLLYFIMGKSWNRPFWRRIDLAAILDFFIILNMHFNWLYIDYLHTKYQENRSASFQDMPILWKKSKMAVSQPFGIRRHPFSIRFLRFNHRWSTVKR